MPLPIKRLWSYPAEHISAAGSGGAPGKNIYATLFWGLFAFSFLSGIWLRFKLDTLPAATLDTWGFLKPAVCALSGGNFETEFGRPFIYPAFLYGTIGIGGFRAVTVLQHMSALVAAGLLFGVLLMLRRRQKGFLPVLLTDAAFWLCITTFLTNNWHASFEHTLISEAFMPLLCCGVLFCFAGLYCSRENRLRWAVALAATGAFSALYQPRWILLAVFCAFCGALSIWRAAVPRGRGLRACALPFASLLVLWLAGKYFSRNDLLAQTTSGDILFSAHAPAISRALAAQADKSAGPDAAFLRGLSAELAVPRSAGYFQWTGACREIAAHFNYDGGRARAFETRWFLVALAREPGWYCSKVLREMGCLYGWSPRMVFGGGTQGLPFAFAMGLGKNGWKPLQGGWFYGFNSLVDPWWRHSPDAFWQGRWAVCAQQLHASSQLNGYARELRMSVSSVDPDGSSAKIGGIAGGLFDNCLYFNIAYYVPGLLLAVLAALLVTWRGKWNAGLADLAVLSSFSHLCVFMVAALCSLIFTFEDLRYIIDLNVFMYMAQYCGLAFIVCSCAVLVKRPSST
jgi:hypothetical protein